MELGPKECKKIGLFREVRSENGFRLLRGYVIDRFDPFHTGNNIRKNDRFNFSEVITQEDFNTYILLLILENCSQVP